jgi:peroxiredoxin
MRAMTRFRQSSVRSWLGLNSAVRRLLVSAALLLTACRKEPSPEPLVGQQAPAIKLETLDHGRFYLHDQRGKPVVLVFWDTSCQICKRELVEVESMRSTMGPETVVVAGVCQDPENVDLARALVQGLGLGFPTLLDQEGRVSKAYGVNGFPTTIVISPAGTVGFVREGYTEPLMRQLRSTVQGYLEASSHGG